MRCPVHGHNNLKASCETCMRYLNERKAEHGQAAPGGVAQLDLANRETARSSPSREYYIGAESGHFDSSDASNVPTIAAAQGTAGSLSSSRSTFVNFPSGGKCDLDIGDPGGRLHYPDARSANQESLSPERQTIPVAQYLSAQRSTLFP